ncbi:MAG: hypothetical protein ACYS8W_14895 [Planctomycetota bacterium]
MPENPFMFPGSLPDTDPEISRLADLEADRQRKKLIFIASESICPRPVREALMTTFTNLYAEGYPALRMYEEERDELADYARQLAYQRRYSDRRYYKGTEYANFAEALAIRRAAKLFASDHTPADGIHVNVQPMSGAMANNAVYESFCEPGDTVMGMELSFGGHLTHGSDANRSGKRYRMVSYQPDLSGKLDYDAMKKVALAEKPKLIIAGYSAYPWAIDWWKMREVADSVGTILCADISHPAGLVVAGEFPNPVGIVDVSTLTTHKTLCGPRGVSFGLAATPEFRELQKKVASNAKAMAASFEKRGIKIAYGGTNSHLFLIDLRSIKTASGMPITGEIGSRILDMAGITANKNTIGGDENAAHPSGIRFGMTWATQRGLGPDDLDQVAGWCIKLLTSTHSYSYIEATGDAGRGKLDMDLLEEVKKEVYEFNSRFPDGQDVKESKARDGYPYWFAADADKAQAPPVRHNEVSKDKQAAALESGAALYDLGDHGMIEIIGDRATVFLDELSTADIAGMKEGETKRTLFLDRDGKLVSRAIIARSFDVSPLRKRFFVICPREDCERLTLWMRWVSDGYVLFDNDDVYRKVQGPVVVNDLALAEKPAALLAVTGPKVNDVIGKALGRMDDAGPGACTVAGECIFVCNDGDTNYLIVPRLVEDDVWNRIRDGGAVPCGAETLETFKVKARLIPASETGDSVSDILKNESEPADPKKTYFVGTAHIERPSGLSAGKKKYEYKPEDEPVLKTCLYDEHMKLKPRMAAFAGHEMPVWYSSIIDEHRAVREAAGLFDVSHMGVLDVRGREAWRFMDMVSSNYIVRLRPGQSIYGYLFYPDGICVDDILTYCISPEHYMVVFNAANIQKDLAWINAVNSGKIIIDEGSQWITPPKVEVRYLKDESVGADMRVDIALQGPASLPTILKLAGGDRVFQGRIRRIKRTDFIECELAGIPMYLSRTGYTGEPYGYEFYVHPENAPAIWNKVLEAGEEFGVKPAGLGARDSTRTEAGLPLYGHELEGDFRVNPIEAGYGPFVKLHKPFFIGRKHAVKMAESRERETCRFRVTGGMRKVNPGDALVNMRGNQFIGNVTSCVFVNDTTQVGLAVVQRRYNREGWEVNIISKPRGKTKGFDELAVGDRFPLGQGAVIMERFPQQKEKESE